MSESVAPLRGVVLKVAEEGRNCDITLQAPDRFAQEMAASRPHFANQFVVSRCAVDGVSCNDPVLPLYRPGWAGLAIELGQREVPPEVPPPIEFFVLHHPESERS